MVRKHFDLRLHLSDEQLCKLFCLSIEGLLAIRRGADWHPAFVAPAPASERIGKESDE